MPETAIRFGVFNNGHRAATWKCWTLVGSGRPDVFLTCRELGGSMHVSLHATGFWHVAFAKDKIPTLFSDGEEPESRRWVTWDTPAPIAEGCTLAVRIHTPWSAVTVPALRVDPDVVRIAAPPQGQTNEVAVFIVDAPEPPRVHWPGSRSMGTSLVGGFPLDGGKSVCIVSHDLHAPPPTIPQPGRVRFFRGKSTADLAGGDLRMILYGNFADGSPALYEARVALDTAASE